MMDLNPQICVPGSGQLHFSRLGHVAQEVRIANTVAIGETPSIKELRVRAGTMSRSVRRHRGYKLEAISSNVACYGEC